ncbi:MAG: hypothetical protein HQM09_12955 [Candidatus Riflebacteria bacterium]|nr:hypothetical protein [Candidatus Riflebacteria bacterium]
MSNPFDFGGNLMEQWEKNMAESVERLTKDEEFLRNISKAFTASLDMKHQLETHIEKYLKSINMPTKGDLERILSYLQRIEEKLLDLEDHIQVMEQRSETVTCNKPEKGSKPAAPSASKAPAKKAPAKKTAGSAKKSPASGKKR